MRGCEVLIPALTDQTQSLRGTPLVCSFSTFVLTYALLSELFQLLIIKTSSSTLITICCFKVCPTNAWGGTERSAHTINYLKAASDRGSVLSAQLGPGFRDGGTHTNYPPRLLFCPCESAQIPASLWADSWISGIHKY